MISVTASIVPFGPCKGDWQQKGCASGKPSVHNVETHGVERDQCASHSPWDVNDRTPEGSIIRFAGPAA